MSAHPMAGPRQTVSTIEHPTRGRMVWIRDNGPTLLVDASGNAVDERVHAGGADESGSYAVVGGLRCRVVEEGEIHWPIETAFGGFTWLVWAPSGRGVRFENDDCSKQWRSEWVGIRVGRRGARLPPKRGTEWRTIELNGEGSVKFKMRTVSS